MKQQVARLSPHQNGKVFAVLTAITSLIFFVPFFFLMSAFGPAQARPPMFMLVVMPLAYLVITYVMTAVGCAIYNVVYQVVGGIEYESKESGS